MIRELKHSIAEVAFAFVYVLVVATMLSLYYPDI